MASFDADAMRGAQAAFGLASRLICEEPNIEWARTCAENRLFSAAPFGENDPAVADGLAKLSAWCAESSATGMKEAVDAIKREWLRLFVGLGAPEAPVWESFYTEPNSTMFGRSTLDVRAAYRAWGLEFERKRHEPDDSLGIMLAFCSYLMGREIEAAEAFDVSGAAKASKALEEFMVQHMLPWASAWRFLVRNHASSDYYRGVGELVFGLMRAYAARFDIACNEGDGTFSYAKRS